MNCQEVNSHVSNPRSASGDIYNDRRRREGSSSATTQPEERSNENRLAFVRYSSMRQDALDDDDRIYNRRRTLSAIEAVLALLEEEEDHDDLEDHDSHEERSHWRSYSRRNKMYLALHTKFRQEAETTRPRHLLCCHKSFVDVVS